MNHKKGQFLNKLCHYSVRKTSLGVGSVLIGIFVGASVVPMPQVVAAEEVRVHEAGTEGLAHETHLEEEAPANSPERVSNPSVSDHPATSNETESSNSNPELAQPVVPENESAVSVPTAGEQNESQPNRVSEQGAGSDKPMTTPVEEAGNRPLAPNPKEAEVEPTPSHSKEQSLPIADRAASDSAAAPVANEDPFAGNEVLRYEGLSVNEGNGNRIDISGDLGTLRTLESATLYMEYKQLKENPGFYNLFSVSSSTNRNEYISLFVFDNGVPGLDGHNQDTSDLFYSRNYVKGPLKLKPQEWNAVAVTIDPATNKVRMYVNGVLNRTEALSNVRFVKDLQTADKVQFGATSRGTSGNHWGSIFDIRNFTVYNRVLSPEEIATRSELFSRSSLPEESTTEGLSDPIKVMASGSHGGKNLENVGYYRIPSLLVTDKGTLIAGADERHDTYSDWGNIDMIVKRSTDGGKTWSRTIKMLDLQTNPNAANKATGTVMSIDMALVQDPATKRIFSVYDVFPEMQGAFGLPNAPQERYTEIDGQHYLNLFKEGEERPYTLRNGKVYDPNGQETDYRVVTESKTAPYREIGDIYKGEEKLGNVYFQTNSGSPFRVAKMNYLWMSYSDDDGQTWSSPRDITPTISKSWMKFHGVGPGSGIVLHTGEHAGRIVIPTYTTNFTSHFSGSQSSRVIYSDDHGETWHLGKAVNDGRTLADGTVLQAETMNHSNQQNTEASLVQLNNGHLLIFMRNLSGKVQMARSRDGGATWLDGLTKFEDVNDVYVQLSATHTVQDGQEYVILVNADGSGRNNGKIRLARVEADGSLTWIKHKELQSGKFAYNSVKQISDKEFGVLYEHSAGNENDYNIVFRKFTWDYLLDESKVTITEIEKVSDEVVRIRLSHPVLAVGQPNLTLSNGNKAQFLTQSDRTNLYYSITAAEDWGSEITGVVDGEIVQLNHLPVEIAGRLDPKRREETQPPVSDIRFEEKYGSRISEVFDTATEGNSWVFVGGKNVQSRFDQQAGIRNFVGQFEEYIRWTKSANENGRERYVINAAKAGKDIAAIDEQFESLVTAYNPRVVDYMLGEEDYQKGVDYLATFKEKLRSFIEKGLALREDDGFVVLQSPHAFKDVSKNDQIALYTQAMKEVLADYYTDPRRNRLVFADHYYHTNTPGFKENFLQEDALTPRGEGELARQLSYFTIKRTDAFPTSEADFNLQPIPQAKSYLDLAPVARYQNGQLEVTVPEVDGVTEWSYTLLVGARQIADKGLGNQFTITGLEDGQTYELIVKSADGSKQLAVVGGTLVDQEAADKVSWANEQNQDIQDKLAGTKPLTWLFMGDSITHGALWTKGYDSVPQLFEKYLLQDLHRENDVVINTAVSGATSEDTVRRLESRLEQYQPDVVVVMLGANDSLTVTPEKFKENLQTIVNRAKLKNASVIFRTPTPTKITARSANLPALIEKMREVAEENRILLVDQYTPLNDLLTSTPYLWEPKYTYMADSPALHPGANGQAYLNSLLIGAIGNVPYASSLGNLAYQVDRVEHYHSHKPEFVLHKDRVEVDLDKIAEAIGLPLADILVSVHKDGSDKVVEVGGIAGKVSSGRLDEGSDYYLVVRARESNTPITHLLRRNYFSLGDKLAENVPTLERLIDDELLRHTLLDTGVEYTAPTVERYKNALAALRLAKADQLPKEEVEALIQEVYQARDALMEKRNKLGVGDFADMAAAAQPGEEIARAFDNSSDSLWHSPWSGNFRNQKIQLRLQAPVELTHFEYVPRQSGSNGRFKSGILKVTDTAGQVHEFPFSNWADTSDTKVIRFPEGLVATALELIMNESHGSPANQFGSAAELRFVSKVYPDPVLDEEPYQTALANVKKRKSDEAKRGIAMVEALHYELATHHLLTDTVLANLIERLNAVRSDPIMDWFADEHGDLDKDGDIDEEDVRAWLRDETKPLGPHAKETAQTHVLSFETIRRENAELPLGTERVIQVGRQGERVVKIRTLKLADRELEEIASDMVTLPALAEIIEVGTKEIAPTISYREEKQIIEVPFEILRKIHPDLPQGVERVIQTGEVGEKIVTIRITTVDGVEQREIISEEDIKIVRHQIVEVGSKRQPDMNLLSTKEVPTKDMQDPAPALISKEQVPVKDKQLPRTAGKSGVNGGIWGLFALGASYGLVKTSKRKKR
ncbi:sialidase domain-containing protein [Streptococcus azizii]|uniref:sialidase domain-containing protein n=1 Tax=Streptococcus azizii TaxID=1579424 RepID=UPI00097BFFBC|nr:sialidase domain-containing protein [Streptococcus azizii]ONK30453.1 hypothetical protein BVE85_00610 [Streptococcus azizii]